MEGTGPERVREELAHILASTTFDASGRNREFLRYVVEETLAGRAERIKAYAIATSVFGRGGDFDPQLDSIVRIEAGRLRRSLERYYLTDGQTSGLCISIPRGSYVPAFELRNVAPARDHAATVALVRHGPSILVRPFEQESEHHLTPSLGRGLTRQVIIGLTRYTDLFVFGAETTFAGAAEVAQIDTDFLLTAAITEGADRFTVGVLLADARSGRFVWGESYERPLEPAAIARLRDEVASAVVRSLAQPYGVLFADRAREAEGKPSDSLTTFECVVRFYQYWRTYEREMFAELREGLEHAVAAEPGYADARACLALLYVDAYRYGFTDAGAGSLDRAVSLARRAVELAPLSSRSHHALGMAYWFSGDIDGSIAALETGLSLNPNDTDIMAELGLRHANRAEWDLAIPLLEGSYARNPAQPSTYRIGLFLWHLWHGRLSAALVEARKVDAPHVVFGHIAIAVAAAGLGRHQEASQAIEAVLAIDPGYGMRAGADLTQRNIHPHLVELVIQGLTQAGLPGVAPPIACAS